MHKFLKFIFGIKRYMFRTIPLAIIRSFSLYTQQWYMSYRFASKPVWHISVLQAEACNTDTTPTQPHRNSNTHRTKNNTTNVVIQQNSLKLLMKDILMSETCWAHKKWNKIASDIKLVFYSSTITMLHGPINVRSNVWFQFLYRFCLKYFSF